MRRQMLFSVDENWPFPNHCHLCGYCLASRGVHGKRGGGGGRWWWGGLGSTRTLLSKQWLVVGPGIAFPEHLVFSDCSYSRGLHKYEAAPVILVYT